MQPTRVIITIALVVSVLLDLFGIVATSLALTMIRTSLPPRQCIPGAQLVAPAPGRTELHRSADAHARARARTREHGGSNNGEAAALATSAGISPALGDDEFRSGASASVRTEPHGLAGPHPSGAAVPSGPEDAPPTPSIKLSHILFMVAHFGLHKLDLEKLGCTRHVELAFAVVQLS